MSSKPATDWNYSVVQAGYMNTSSTTSFQQHFRTYEIKTVVAVQASQVQ
jgi:hypothetical protein